MVVISGINSVKLFFSVQLHELFKEPVAIFTVFYIYA